MKKTNRRKSGLARWFGKSKEEIRAEMKAVTEARQNMIDLGREAGTIREMIRQDAEDRILADFVRNIFK